MCSSDKAHTADELGVVRKDGGLRLTNFPVGWKGTRITSFRPDAEKGGGSQSEI